MSSHPASPTRFPLIRQLRPKLNADRFGPNDKIAMANAVRKLTEGLLKVGITLLVANEIRGLVLTAPVLYGMYDAGGTLMAVWIGVCSLAGIAISVVGPFLVARRLRLV